MRVSDEQAADSLAADSAAAAVPLTFLSVRALSGTTQELHHPLRIEFDQPLAAFLFFLYLRVFEEKAEGVGGPDEALERVGLLIADGEA